jgi:2-methylcitrate dehydratase PrpD
MNHRLIAAGFAARAQLPRHEVPDDATIRVTAPFGNTVALRVHDPVDGLGAKFCGPYNIAAALLQGRVTLADFEDDAVARPELRALMERIDLSEEPRADESVIVGFDHGTVRLSVERNGDRIAFAEIDPYPGSPRRKATAAEMELKIDDCLGIFRRRSNSGPTVPEFRDGLRRAIGA